MSKVVPDQVEQDVNNYWRQLYKLERQFQNQPVARKMAGKFKKTVFFKLLSAINFSIEFKQNFEPKWMNSKNTCL